MDDLIVAISDRGQITIPLHARKKLPVKYFIFKLEEDHIVLEPLQTRDEFIEDLEERKKNGEKNAKGGLTLAEMKKKHKL